ncbi:hypothetical protein [Microbacterium enclense]|uniref:Uncharacterized protein n=1 Tax=Microbacterium enclense TaxID=993073 RepID=A0A1G6NXB4_9MICO|nr:hypothetical protein [Microbacterium enclense]KSU52906.1 hypothetical protein AS029_12930 [Microbacterium enclense]SDC71805.1 hypothetical protein SAMN05216418_2866 [Microbacterium enclense]
MTVDAWVAIATVAAVVVTAVAGLTKATADLIGAWRRPDKTPAPEVGIPAVAEHVDDDIDYRAYADMKDQLKKAETRAEKAEGERDYWMRRALGIDEDTHPT